MGLASSSPHKTFIPDVGYVRNVRMRFMFFRRPLPNCYDYDGYGDLTAVYGRDGKKLRGFAYRNHIMVEHNQPDGLVSRYEYDRYDTDSKVLKSSNNLGEEWTFDYRKDHTVVTDALGRTEVYGFDENRELVYRIDADGQRSDSERDSYGRITVERDPLGRERRQQTHYFHYDRNLIMVIIDIENLHLLSFNFIEEVYAMNLDAVNPELESKINDLVCETYNKSFLEQEKLLKEAFELIPKPVTQWAHPTTMVAIALFDLYYKNQKYEQAEEWLIIALSVADLGTTNAGTYLLGGLFYYDIEKYDDAYKYFDIAYNDAGYYPFSIEDKKYWQFYKQRKEELNPKKKTKK